MAEENAKEVKMGRKAEMALRPKPKLKNPGATFKRLVVFAYGNYVVLAVIAITCLIISVLSSLYGTMFTRDLIDDYIKPMLEQGSNDFGPLLRKIIQMVIVYGVGVIATFAQSMIMVKITQGTLNRLRKTLFNRMETLPIKYFDTHAHGDIMSIYTNDVDALRQMISQSMPQLINSVITITGVVVCMFMLSIPLTFTMFITVFIMVFVTAKVAGKSGENFIRQQKNLGTVNGYIEEMMQGQKVVKAFCHEEEGIKKFNELNDELYDSASKANKFVNIIGPINGQLGHMGYVICAIVGGLLTMDKFGALSVGSVVAFLTYYRAVHMPITQVSQQFNSIVMALAGAERVFDLMDEAPEPDEGYVTLVNAKEKDGKLIETPDHTGRWAWKHYHKADDTTTYVELKGDVEFNDVDFGYSDDKIVLHNIKISATPGQKIAFVGSTGAGKTTITNLINRFYDIQDGKIRYDGININKIKKADLRRSLGIVLQDTHLFTGTVKENILYGKLNATEEEVIAAAKLANAHGFITRLPDGYDTMLTGDGANLSQGQRQLIAIARAAIADPPVLILDEATSSIDTRTEKLVQAGMDSLMKGRTTFVIAHRLSTIKNADCIMVLEQGRIIERGNHEQLLEKKGKYYSLYTGNKVS